MEYIQIPKTITYKDLIEKYSFSPNKYKNILLKNKNTKKIGQLISAKPQKGQEVGSSAYVYESNFYFLRTKALKSSCFLPAIDDTEQAVPILPTAFKDFKLKEGDILISKDGNIGEAAYLNRDLHNYMISGGLVQLKFPKDITHYVFAFMKNSFFQNQINLMVSKGATIKHAKDLWMDVLIPFPNQHNKYEVIEFVNLLTRAIIRKEAEIKKKYNKIIELIDKEIRENQKLGNKFNYNMPRINELREITRLDAGIFCRDYKGKQFFIENYIYSTESIFDAGFKLKRGQNLQVSQIGNSIYTDEYKPNFYKLIRPENLSDYGTVAKYEYLGNPQKLQTLNKGEILFSAEGTIGKFCVFIDVDNMTITNIHGITIYGENNKDNIESIFLGLYLGYLRKIGILDYISVGGQGGSLAQNYWEHIKIPKLPKTKKEEIAKYYYNPIDYKENGLCLTEFENEDIRITAEGGILQLDKQIKLIKEKLNNVLNKITMDEEVEISFEFVNHSTL